MMRTPAGHKVYAMAAEYPSAAALYEAAKHVRDAGFKRWDVYSPFPIHGMDAAMGLRKSWLSGWVLFGGVTGLLTAAVVEFGPSSILYQLDVHGKPWNFWTVPAFFPIMFELTVLLGAFVGFDETGMFLLGKLAETPVLEDAVVQEVLVRRRQHTRRIDLALPHVLLHIRRDRGQGNAHRLQNAEGQHRARAPSRAPCRRK